MHLGQKLRKAVSVGAVGAALMASLAATSVSGASNPRGTLLYAEAPGASPNFIFPYQGCAFASVNNINQFQRLMFRPLYWFGRGTSADFMGTLSPAYTPVFSNGDRTLTIKMKGWKFADGQLMDARSVMFFLNMYRADPTAYCGYDAGRGIPDQVKSAAGSGNVVRINFTTAVNQNWIIRNFLSEITPMADSWDRTATSHSAACATGHFGATSTNAQCKAVEAYLTAQSTIPTTFTDAMWQSGIDGPWRLTQFDLTGNATFRPNAHYSGPQKAQVAVVKEIAYTSTQTEESDLLADKLSIGYIDPSVLSSSAPSPGTIGANWGPLVPNYTLTTSPTWSFNFAALNFSPEDPNSALVGQLYIRQALQYAIDQNNIIQHAYKGYGTVIDSPLPPGTPLSLSGPITNPYSHNLEAALTLLSAHGWTMENGEQTCTNAGAGTDQCGKGIAAGEPLSLSVVWTSGTSALNVALSDDVTNWQSIGIQVTHTITTFNSVISDCTGASGFEICAWGTGWSYLPSYYPSGESLFTAGGDFNVDAYSNAQMTGLINATTSGSAKLTAYAAFAAQQLPVLYQPQGTSLVEINKKLKNSVGLAPDSFGDFMPEYFHF